MKGSATLLSARRFRRLGGSMAALLLVAALFVAGPGPAGAVTSGSPPFPMLVAGESTHRYIVTAASPSDRVSLVASFREAGVRVRDEFTEVLEGVAVSLSDRQYLALKDDPRVESVSRDEIVSLDTTLEPGSAGSSKDPDIIPGRYIVQIEPSLSSGAKTKILDIIGDGLVASYTRAITGYAAELTEAQVAELRAQGGVLLVEPDRVVRAVASQNNATWGLDRIDQRNLPLDSTFNYVGTGSGVKAYVIDSGIAPHAEFGNRVVSGFVASGLSTTLDGNGHGTHVAGTIGSATWGVAKDATLVPVRVLDDAGRGTSAGVISGVEWVISDHSVGEKAVANLSLGGGASSSLDLAISNLVADGVVTVVAAGNNGADACAYSPARAPSAVTVGATVSTDARASFSNYGACLDIFAPGEGITSTWLGQSTSTISGTSMASPHVAGAAAAYWSQFPTKTSSQVVTDLLDMATVNKVSDPGSGSINKLLYLAPAVGTAPGTPSDVSASVSSSGILVSWTAPTDSGGTPITSYDVATSQNVPACSVSADSTSCAPRGLAPGSYQFKVRATNDYGSSAYSSLSSPAVAFTGEGDNNYFAGREAVVPGAAALTDSNVDATREPSEPTIGYSNTYRTLWYSYAPAEDGTLTLDLLGSAFDTVLGVYTGSSVSALTKVAENDDDNYSAGVLTSRLSLRVSSGVEYKIQVGSYWDTGGAIRLTASFAGLVAPNPPTNVRGTAGDARVFVTWSAPASLPEIVSRYVATVEPSGRQCEVAAPATSCLIGSLTNGVSYTVSVVAWNSVGPSSSATGVEPVTPAAGPTGSRAARTWGVDRIDQRSNSLDGIYSPPSDGSGVRVYVVDTGVRPTHQDFTGRVESGVSMVPGESSFDDCHGHGTHVASSAAGATLGVASQANIVPVRVLDCFGSAYTSEVIAGLEWVAQDVAADRVPAVVNMSLGGSADSDLDRAVEALVAQGVPVVVAAGNESADACTTSPAGTPGAVTVGASTMEDAVASFSNVGRCVDVIAPGSKILGAGISSDSAEVTYSGTSMASPHVAGYVAVVLGMFPNLDPVDVSRAIVGSSTTDILSGVPTGTVNRLLYAASSKCTVAGFVGVNCTTGAKLVEQPVEVVPPAPVDPTPAVPVTTVPATTAVETPRPARAEPATTVVETPAPAPSVVTFATGSARTVSLTRVPSQSAATAPRVTVTRDVPVVLRVPGLPSRSRPTVTVKSRHGSVDVGKVRVSKTGSLRLPKLSFSRTGVYTFAFTVGRRTFFTKVSVVRPVQAKALSLRSVTVVR